MVGPPSPPLPHPPTASASTALVHLYRGELGRLTAYRRRLDTTTNWAISFVSAAVGLTLGTDYVPHTVAPIAMVLLVFLLMLEADRLRAYQISVVRVRLLETGFFQDELSGNTAWTWVGPLLDHLQHPTPPISQLAAVAWRVRRTYLWIYLVLLAVWLLKLQSTTGGAWRAGALVEGASIGPVPGVGVCVVVGIFYGGLIALAVLSARRVRPPDGWGLLTEHRPTAQPAPDFPRRG